MVAYQGWSLTIFPVSIAAGGNIATVNIIDNDGKRIMYRIIPCHVPCLFITYISR